MQVLDVFFSVLEVLLFCYLLFISAYNSLLSFAGLRPLKYKTSHTRYFSKIAVFIPAYKEDAVIYDTCKNILDQGYSKDKFHVYVIADALEPATLKKLKELSVKLIKVHFKRSTKVKALNAAFKTIEEQYDLCVVLDADNFIATDFLSVINKYFKSGFQSIQGQRLPKNMDTKMAVLDGLSEAINNHLVRKGTCALGGSSAIVGSGFAVKYDLLREVLAGMTSVGGFDKELEIRLLQAGIKTIYVEDAKIFDEKVQNQEVFKKQRTRWIASQFFYLKKYFSLSMKAFLQGNFVLFNSAFLRYAQLPRFLNLGLISFVTLIFYFFHSHLLIPFPYYLFLFSLFVASVFFAIPKTMYTLSLLKAAIELPKTFFNMFLLLFRLKRANKGFIHTPHQNRAVEK